MKWHIFITKNKRVHTHIWLKTKYPNQIHEITILFLESILQGFQIAHFSSLSESKIQISRYASLCVCVLNGEQKILEKAFFTHSIFFCTKSHHVSISWLSVQNMKTAHEHVTFEIYFWFDISEQISECSGTLLIFEFVNSHLNF